MKYKPPQPQSYSAETAALITKLKDRIKRLEAVTNDPHALWANWLRGDVKLPEGIGDVREYQDRIKRLEEAGDKMEPWCSEYGPIYRWRKAKEAKLCAT